MSEAAHSKLARERLGELWTAPHAYGQVAEVVRDLIPSAEQGLVYDWCAEDEPGECGHTFDPSGTGWGAVPSVFNGIRALRQYSPNEPDRFANRAVTTRALFHGRGEVLEDVRGLIWKKLGAHCQLRVTLYDRGRLTAMVAVLKDRPGIDFSAGEAALLDSIVGRLGDALTAARALGAVPAGRSTMARVLDAFQQPAFLALGSGAVAYANIAARAAYPATPAWLTSVLRIPERHRLLAGVTRVEHEGRSLYLVVPRAPPVAPSARRRALPLSLSRVADLVADGLSDKEIATSLGVSVATARTYVQRIYRVLGVRSRVELRAFWRS